MGATVFPISSLAVVLSDESVNIPVTRTINFTGTGVTVTDNPTNNETDVIIPGVSGGQVVTLRTVAPPYAVVTDDYALHISAAGTVTLPTPTSGRMLQIKRLSAGADVTLSPSSGTIDGVASYTLAGQYQSVTLMANGTNWFVH